MKIPKTLKIGGQVYRVLVKDFVDEGNESLCGYAIAGDNIIAINHALPQSQQESTFLHEVIEVVNNNYELKLEHPVIQTLEAALYQVLVDNKLLK